MDRPAAAPVLSTPDTHIFEDPTPISKPVARSRLSDEQVIVAFEIERTIREIREGKWKRIALQFPDRMLGDAPRVFDLLARRLRQSRQTAKTEATTTLIDGVDGVSNGLQKVEISLGDRLDHEQPDQTSSESEERLTILGDTSYGACCVDEIAAEHVDADVVIHYGRTCLSPTARLPVIYVFTTSPLDCNAVVTNFQETFRDKESRVVVMADIPYQSHVDTVVARLQSVGYTNIFATSIIHDPSSPLPNRTIPPEAQQDHSLLQNYSLFHISDPPTSLLLNVSSRVSSIYIFPTDHQQQPDTAVVEASTSQMLRRRYALVTSLSTIPVFGILINTLSVKNYMRVLSHVQDLITKSGKKYYTFVVGKINAAKVANFSEVDGWVVIGCWESSLIESQDFWKPIITPYELELALTDQKDRLWTGAWDSNFQALIDKKSGQVNGDQIEHETEVDSSRPKPDKCDSYPTDDEEESEPPVFDLRTGRYVSQSRPLARSEQPKAETKTSQSITKRNIGEVAQIGGELSPAAHYLRTQRTWQGLGTDHEVAYEFDQEGNVQGAQMEEGRSGIAKGYAVGESSSRT